MAALYELVGLWKQVYNMADDPEMDAQAWLDTMEGIEGEIEVKAENYGKVIRMLEADEAALKAEIDRMTARAKTIDNRVASLKNNLKETMIALGKDKLTAGTFAFSVAKNGGKTPLVVAEGTKAEDLPEEFITHPAPVINNEAIRAALDAGKELEFAHYGERGTNLRIK